MEFVDFSRYFDLKTPRILPFSQLRTMQPIWMTQDLTLSDRPGNKDYARQLAEKSLTVVPIRREPPFEKFLNRSTFPRRILFEMTSECNFLCRMCPQQKLTRPRMHMAGNLYRKIIDEIDYYGIEGLWIYHLGEPLLHPEFKKNIGHINTKKNLGVTWMSSNLALMNEDLARFILGSSIQYVNLSVHAVTEQTYRTVIDKDVFSDVQKNLEKLYQLKGSENLPRKPFLHVQMIEQETTRHEVDVFIEKHYKRADIVSINMLEYVNIDNNTFGFNQRKRSELKSCTRVSRNDCFICSNGWVTLCDAAFNGEILLGDIHNNTLHEIWNGSERNRILNLNASGRMREIEFCRNCTDYDI